MNEDEERESILEYSPYLVPISSLLVPPRPSSPLLRPLLPPPPPPPPQFERFVLRGFAKQSEDMVFCPKCGEWFVEVSTTDNFVDLWKRIQCGDEACGHIFCGR